MADFFDSFRVGRGFGWRSGGLRCASTLRLLSDKPAACGQLWKGSECECGLFHPRDGLKNVKNTKSSLYGFCGRGIFKILRVNEKSRTIIFALPFFLLGSALFCLGCYWAILGKHATSWEQVPGTVIGMKESSSRIKGHSVSRVTVTYAYEFRGKSYEGDRLGFGGSGSDELPKIQYGSGGREVLVWVDPEKPDRSVLVAGVMSGAIVFITLGSLVLGFMVFVLLSFRRNIPSRSPE